MRQFRSAAIVVPALTALAVGWAQALPAAAAGPTASGVFVACGYADVVAGGGTGTCGMSLQQALDAAVAYGYDATVVMLPGDYCPITVPATYHRLAFVGAGFGGFDTSGGPVSFSGPEASLSTFVWNGTNCGGSAPSASVTVQGNDQGRVTFRNITVDGSGGPSTGITTNNVTLVLRDVLIEHTTDTGLHFLGGDHSDLEVANSAFIDDHVGVYFAGEGSIDESTVADNSVVGIQISGSMHFDNNTISHNGTGVYISGFGNSVQVANSIVAGNTTDCGGTVQGDWEPNGDSGGNGYNIEASSCTGTGSSATNHVPTGGTIFNEPALNGGPTPSIAPPAQATGAAQPGYCGSTGTDQREYVYTGGAACDVGAQNSTGDGTAVVSPQPNPVDFGTVPVGLSDTRSVSVYDTGGGLVSVSDVGVSGTGFSIVYDSCTYALLQHLQGNSCFVNVKVTPGSQGPLNGTLAFHDTAGTQTVDLTAVGGPPVTLPGAPTAVHGTPGNHRVTLSWTAPGDDGGTPITGYDVQYSSNDGSTWTPAPTNPSTGTSQVIQGLTNGTAYVFEVAAENQVGPGPDSVKSATVTPKAPTHPSQLTVSAPAGTSYGKKILVSTVLTDATTHSGIGAAAVTLLSRAGSHGAFHQVAKETTTAGGGAKAAVTPTVDTTYEWQFTGTGVHAAATGPRQTVSVAQVVHAALASSSVKRGKVAEVYGTVSPNEKGQSVALQVLVHGHWKTLSVVATIHRQLLPNHRTAVGFVLRITENAAGTYRLRVLRSATTSNTAGVSKRLTVTVT